MSESKEAMPWSSVGCTPRSVVPIRIDESFGSPMPG
jgi:hypothetical protein